MTLVSAAVAGVAFIAVLTLAMNVEVSMSVSASFKTQGVAGVSVGTVGDATSVTAVEKATIRRYDLVQDGA